MDQVRLEIWGGGEFMRKVDRIGEEGKIQGVYGLINWVDSGWIRREISCFGVPLEEQKHC